MTKETRIYNGVKIVFSVRSAGKNWTASCKRMKLEHWKAKGGSQEIPGVMGKLSLGGQNEEGQRLTEFCQENTLIIASTLFQQHKRTPPDGQY